MQNRWGIVLQLGNFVIHSNKDVHTIGPELIFGSLFDYIGFNQIKDELFRHLVITRLAYPGSKLKTIDYLKRYQNVEINKDEIYHFMDELHNHHQDQVETTVFNHTKKILVRPGRVSCKGLCRWSVSCRQSPLRETLTWQN